MSIYQFSAMTIDGETVSLEKYQGYVVLIVNTASKCGFTPQFEGLEALYQKYKDQKFVVLGFPCNQFGNQDPGDNDEIASFCKLNYGVTFPMFARIDVNGDEAHPLFNYLKEAKGGIFGDAIKWNFTKFLVDRDGVPVERYGSQKKPESIADDIEKLL